MQRRRSTTIGISAPPTLCAVFHSAHQPPRSVREYRAVSSRAQTGEPQPKKAFSAHSSAKAHSEEENRTEYSPPGGNQPQPHKIAGVGAVADDTGENFDSP